MIERKRKLRVIQASLFLLGVLIIIFTYSEKNKPLKETIITSEIQKKVESQIDNNSQQGDIFYNIEYSGLDLTGNRYVLKSKEAINKKSDQDIVLMKSVEAIFYFKDDTTLQVSSDTGAYNNKTLDMAFNGNVRAEYEGSKLFAQKAKYSNTKSFLSIDGNVKINDLKGTMVADKLLFDIKKQKLNIASFNDGKVNANINLK
tara:strand:- start:3172 stop:3777 length:606 start_codon:yes stop_codon:yes gene_type:complete